MGSRLNRFVGVLIAGSMFVSSTGAVAASSAAAAPQINPWAALTALTGGAPAAALAGSAVVAQNPPPPAPIPVPPIESAGGGGLEFDPLLLGLGALLAGALIYFVVVKKHHATSPA